MNKAFFVNGGAGRVLCSMPGLERYAKTHDDFIIIAESWSELFLNNVVLRDHVYPVGHKDLFEEKLKDKKIVSLEPYRVNEYFNQKCNLIQAFDIEINELDEIPETGEIKLDLNKEDQITGYNLVDEVKETLKHDKVIVFQPFGQSAKADGKFIYDSTGRSFEVANIISLIEKLKTSFGIILMSEIEIPGWSNLGVASPKGMGLNGWAGVINAADHFIGCDSVGQHLAHAVKTNSTVVIGSTFPENISYPTSKKFTVIDNGKDKRKYSPIRMTFDMNADRNNEDLMVLSPESIDKIVKGIKKPSGKQIPIKSAVVRTPQNTPFMTPTKLTPASSQSVTNIDAKPMRKFGEPFVVSKKKKKKPIDELLDIETTKS
tara:strand:- start:1822 stop:2943 length:1122 start_codon:yes stop_codon:yes gene_type:complete